MIGFVTLLRRRVLDALNRNAEAAARLVLALPASMSANPAPAPISRNGRQRGHPADSDPVRRS